MDSIAPPCPSRRRRGSLTARLTARLTAPALVLASLGLATTYATPASASPAGPPPAAGDVIAWGENTFGATDVPADLAPVTAVAGGFYHSLALRADGTVAAWGQNGSGQATPPSGLDDVTAIAAGDSHSLALTGDGRVTAWGDDSEQQTQVPNGLDDVTAIAAGGSHSLALGADGTVTAWGYNDYGQTDIPSGLDDVTAIGAGVYFSLAVTHGTVVGWGQNDMGQLNPPTGLDGVVAVDGGYKHAIALKGDGTVVAWGSNSDGQSTVPTGLDDVVAIAAGDDYSLALQSDGTLSAWGDPQVSANVPSAVHDVIAFAGGVHHALAIVPGVEFTADSPARGVYSRQYAGYQFAATAPDGSTPTFAVAAGDDLPPGLSLSSNGQLTGKPTDAGSYSFTVVATADDGTKGRTDVEMTIKQRVLRITAEDQAKKAPDADPQFTATYSTLAAGDVVSPPATCSTARRAALPGDYPIACSGADAGDNYRIIYAKGTLTVSKAPTTLTLAEPDGRQVSATLTRTDTEAPIQGLRVRFRDNGPNGIRVLCTDVTDEDGLATCESQYAIRNALSARYPGNGQYDAATDPR